MKRYIFISLTFISVLSATAGGPIRWNQVYQAYIDQYKDMAIEGMLKYGVPASITLAQGLLESGAGRGTLVLQGNNHFGIKCHDWTGASVYHNDDAANECFRSYDNALQSYEDHSRFLKQNSRYRSLFQLWRALRTTANSFVTARVIEACSVWTEPIIVAGHTD